MGDVMRSSGSFSDVTVRNNGLNDAATTGEAKIRNGSFKHKSHKHEAEEWAVPHDRKHFSQKKLTKALSAKLLLDDNKVKVPTNSPPKHKSRQSIRKMLLHGMSGRSSSTSSNSSPTQGRRALHLKEDNSASQSSDNYKTSKIENSAVVAPKNVSQAYTICQFSYFYPDKRNKS